MYQILLVEDDIDQMNLLESVIKARVKKVHVEKAYSGNEAIRKLSHIPDVVVLDLMLPEKSGLDICKYLRSDTQFAATKIIAYSVLEEKDMIKKAFASGVDDYIIKVSDINLLIEKINQYLRP
jgi:two-component system phosphate regulon response regulator PhoB/two-component system alkaline phosphatase synthesis response regulator PhoP